MEDLKTLNEQIKDASLHEAETLARMVELEFQLEVLKYVCLDLIVNNSQLKNQQQRDSELFKLMQAKGHGQLMADFIQARLAVKQTTAYKQFLIRQWEIATR